MTTQNKSEDSDDRTILVRSDSVREDLVLEIVEQSNDESVREHERDASHKTGDGGSETRDEDREIDDGGSLCL